MILSLIISFSIQSNAALWSLIFSGITIYHHQCYHYHDHLHLHPLQDRRGGRGEEGDIGVCSLTFPTFEQQIQLLANSEILRKGAEGGQLSTSKLNCYF